MSDALKSAKMTYEATWASHPNFVIAEMANTYVCEIAGWLAQNDTTMLSQCAANFGISETDYLAVYTTDFVNADPEERAWGERQVARLLRISPVEFWDFTIGNWQTRDDQMIRLVRTIDLDDVAALTTWACFVRARLFLEDAVISHSRKVTERLDAEEELPE